MLEYGTLILGRNTVIEDIDVKKKYAVVTVNKKAKLFKSMDGKLGDIFIPGEIKGTVQIPVPFDGISWIAPGVLLKDL